MLAGTGPVGMRSAALLAGEGAEVVLCGRKLDKAQAAADSAGLVAKIVHHAVEQTKAVASKPEAGLVNAVVRKLATALAAPPPVSRARGGAESSSRRSTWKKLNAC